MTTPNEENFKYYKKAETKALEILAEMKATTPKKMDIELSLLVAIFELHKGEMPAEAISKIVQGHLETVEPYYASQASKSKEP
ncbi:hypothetical protein QEH59_15435 [Coraliomargarita sp. SDUM461004]|uniref:Uncharacterized protein n=1 Tax=Thalassobacterium sedimentorum TaxID=3041258 RepID=A0ABU1ALZ0_9BACT|nr:hypothetical protein [Coraliomargarita sp. SDUM461004]MDQ8195825.1 hypothetical protein [Coraliomargarita sp. SDUM461004]